MLRNQRRTDSRASGARRYAASLAALVALAVAVAAGLLGAGLAMEQGALAAGQGKADSRGNEVGEGMAEYVIYINWDAFRRDYYDWANAEGAPGTPNLNYLVSRGALFTSAENGFPSITNPMQTSIVTGAWPEVHGNIYRYYDPLDNIVRGTGRTCEAETIAEVAAASGLSTASVQQFMLLGRGTADDDPMHLYIQPGVRFEERVVEAVKIIRNEPVLTQTGAMVASVEIPRFLAIYGDDLDAAGHNAASAYGTPIAFTFDEWKAKMVKEVVRMDAALSPLMDALREAEIMDRTAIVLTADHGMTPYTGKSSLSDLIRVFQGLGYKAKALYSDQKAPADVDVVLVGTGISVQVYFRRAPSPQEYRKVVETISAQPYVGGCLTREDLDAMGAHRRSGDLAVWSNPPSHFAYRNVAFGVGGNHDTPHPSSRNVFLLLSGAGVKHGVVIDDPVKIIDVAPTISRLLGIRPPAQATGRVLEEALLPAAALVP